MVEDKNLRDIFMRNALAGALDFLNRNVQIMQTVDGVDTMHGVRFYYNFGQDEQFMKDFFVEYNHDCKLYEHPEGNFEVRPVGVIKFNSFAIRPNDVTNRFVRATFLNRGYTDNMQQTISAYSAYLMRLPMTIKVSVDIQADNLGQAMRVMEAILITIYKSNVMYFQYRGLRVPGEVLMADNVELEKKTEFTYDDDQHAHAKFDLDINTVFPVFDGPSTVSKAHVIREFRQSLNEEQHVIDETTYIEGVTRRAFPVYGQGMY
jgi:hypothetical protein